MSLVFVSLSYLPYSVFVFSAEVAVAANEKKLKMTHCRFDILF